MAAREAEEALRAEGGWDVEAVAEGGVAVAVARHVAGVGAAARVAGKATEAGAGVAKAALAMAVEAG